MLPSPVPADPRWDEDLAWLDRDPEREDWLARAREHDEPPGEDEDCEDYAPLTAAELAEIEEAAADGLLAAGAATTGRRGPGQSGSARVFPGESSSRAAAFGPGMPLDVLAGCAGLAVAAEAAADNGFAGVSEAELVGVLCGWDRMEAHAHARKLAAVAELARRNPGELDAEFTADQVACALGESRARADSLIGMAQSFETRLPGTAAALADGTISRYKAEIIARATALLEDDEARAAEQEVLDRAARLTPGALRAAIARAVITAAPKKAKERRETAAKDARVERWLQDTGNAALMGCELPPDEALAADQQITALAKELKAAGLDGDMDQLRARAYLDLLLSKDSRPCTTQPAGSQPPTSRPVPAGFAGRVTLTVPLATLAGLADRPGELGSLGPVDPWLARDLAAAAAWNPKTTWCLTVTDGRGHAVAHGCARPEPKSHAQHAGPGPPAFSFTPAGRDGPPGGYGTWRLRTPGPGPDLIITIDPITTDPCDHRFESQGHDPGVKLRHLAQVRHSTCTSPICRRPARTCDFEHNTPYEAGGRTCLCNTGPKCRHDHRLKQHPKWTVDQLADGTFRWTTPAGRSYDTEPTRYPI
jgi:hypothetical protein